MTRAQASGLTAYRRPSRPLRAALVLIAPVAAGLLALVTAQGATEPSWLPEMERLVAVITGLSPRTKPKDTRFYADLILFEADWYELDPLLVASYITIESGWNPNKVSKTNDHGLMQVHVGKHSPRFLGREAELRKPRTNIREGCRVLALWKAFHARWCEKAEPHHWLAHVKWGRRIPVGDRGRAHSLLVLKVLEKISGEPGRSRKAMPLGDDS